MRADLGRGHIIPSEVRNLYLLIISSMFADINRSSGPEVALLHQQTDSFILGSRQVAFADCLIYQSIFLSLE